MEGERAEAEVLQLMLELGFTQGECEIYFSLLDRPEGEPIDSVLTGAKMSQGLAESALKSLVDKGLVNVSSNRLEAVEPRVFLSRFQERKRQELSKGLALGRSLSVKLFTLLERRYWAKRLGLNPGDFL